MSAQTKHEQGAQHVHAIMLTTLHALQLVTLLQKGTAKGMHEHAAKGVQQYTRPNHKPTVRSASIYLQQTHPQPQEHHT